MKKEIVVRKAGLKDAKAVYNMDIAFERHLAMLYPAVRDLIDPQLLKKPPLKDVKKNIRKRKKGYFIIEDGGKLKGFSLFEIKKGQAWTKFKKEGYIISLFVLPGNRGKGYGKALMTKTMDFLKEKNCDMLSIGVNLGNDGAHKLYYRLGYKDNYTLMYQIVK
jgi:ribosomal protein S18 acetylase RimI-like enzyme